MLTQQKQSFWKVQLAGIQQGRGERHAQTVKLDVTVGVFNFLFPIFVFKSRSIQIQVLNYVLRSESILVGERQPSSSPSSGGTTFKQKCYMQIMQHIFYQFSILYINYFIMNLCSQARIFTKQPETSVHSDGGSILKNYI